MATIDICGLENLILDHLAEVLETQAGPGMVAGYVDRNGDVCGLVDLGERMPGGIVVLRAMEGNGLNLDGAVKIARERTMES